MSTLGVVMVKNMRPSLRAFSNTLAQHERWLTIKHIGQRVKSSDAMPQFGPQTQHGWTSAPRHSVHLSLCCSATSHIVFSRMMLAGSMGRSSFLLRRMWTLQSRCMISMPSLKFCHSSPSRMPGMAQTIAPLRSRTRWPTRCPAKMPACLQWTSAVRHAAGAESADPDDLPSEGYGRATKLSRPAGPISPWLVTDLCVHVCVSVSDTVCRPCVRSACLCVCVRGCVCDSALRLSCAPLLQHSISGLDGLVP